MLFRSFGSAASTPRSYDVTCNGNVPLQLSRGSERPQGDPRRLQAHRPIPPAGVAAVGADSCLHRGDVAARPDPAAPHPRDHRPRHPSGRSDALELARRGNDRSSARLRPDRGVAELPGHGDEPGGDVQPPRRDLREDAPTIVALLHEHQVGRDPLPDPKRRRRRAGGRERDARLPGVERSRGA